MVDESTKKTLASIPLLKMKASPRDKGEWPDRLNFNYFFLQFYFPSKQTQFNVFKL